MSSSEAARRLRERRRAAGLCIVCGRAAHPDYVKCAACMERIARWRIANAPHVRAQMRARRADTRARIREEVLTHYGGVCQCCGEGHHEFLQLDHIANDGAAHRRENASVGDLWVWAWKNGFPDRLQLLCANCNASYGCYGYCPHTR